MLEPQFANTIHKREQFAVSLRKKKKDQIIKDKRRKIQSKVKSYNPQEIKLIDLQNSVFYKGFEQWIMDGY